MVIERPGVWALPESALMHIEKTILHIGVKTFCWRYDNGRAHRIEVETGLSDGEWIEVTNCQAPGAPGGRDNWAPIDGSEQLILGDLSILADGSPVKVAVANDAKSAPAKPPVEPSRP